MHVVQCVFSCLFILVFGLAAPLNSSGVERSKYAHQLTHYFGNIFHHNKSAEENLFSTLPDELLASILENLDLNSFIRTEQVDRRFSRVMQDRVIRKHLIDKEWKGDSQFAKLMVQDMSDLKDEYLSLYPNRSLSEEKWTDFEISKTRVSQLLYVTFMEANPSKRRHRQDCEDTYTQIKVQGKKVTLCPDLPVENISWDEIQTFLKRLNRLTTSVGYRYTLASRLQRDFAFTGFVSHKNSSENPRWNDFEDFEFGLSEWVLENDGRMPIRSDQENRTLPGYYYSSGYLGTAYLLTRASIDAVIDAAKGPSVPYFPISFRLVRVPILEAER